MRPATLGVQVCAHNLCKSCVAAPYLSRRATASTFSPVSSTICGMSMHSTCSGMCKSSHKFSTNAWSASAASPRMQWFTCSAAMCPNTPASHNSAQIYASAAESLPPDTINTTGVFASANLRRSIVSLTRPKGFWFLLDCIVSPFFLPTFNILCSTYL